MKSQLNLKGIFKNLAFLFTFQISLISIQSIAQVGTLDESFGNNGKAFGIGLGYSNDMAIRSDGKIILVGHTGSNISVGRFLEDGKLDSLFGNDGQQLIQIDPGSPQMNIVMLEDDKFLIAGTQGEYEGSNDNGDPIYNYDILLIRCNENGTIDSSFGTNGIVRSDFLKNDFEYALAVQPDGKILVGGSANNGALLVRYLSNGLPDSEFGENGYRIYASYDRVRSIAVQEDGKIITGSTNQENYFNTKFRLIRYYANGELDKSFGKNGVTISDFGLKSDVLSKIIVQKNGYILAAGNTNSNAVSSDMIIARYLSTGIPDSSFGVQGSGKAVFDTLMIAQTYDFDIQKNGKIVLGGYIHYLSGEPSDFALARFTENGLNDSLFGINGKVVTSFDNSAPANAIAIQSDGKIIAAGYSDPPGTSTDFALARYYGDPVTTHPLIAKIKRWIRNHILNFQSTQDGSMAYYAIEKQTGTGSFKQVASIPANAANNYSYNLSTAATSATDNSYRIKGVAKNGDVVYSDVITDAATTGASFKVYPNPAQQSINISADKPLTLRLQNSNGVVLLTQKVTGNDKMDISKLRAGIYYLVDAESGVSVRVMKE